LKEYIAGCNFIEGSREYKEGEVVIGIDSDRLEFMSNLNGWNGKKMVYTSGAKVAPENKSFSVAPENKSVTSPDIKVQVEENIDAPHEDEDDEILQKASLKTLRQFAKTEGIKGASKMDKEGLINALKSKQE
jgi:hypothetical protein